MMKCAKDEFIIGKSNISNSIKNDFKVIPAPNVANSGLGDYLRFPTEKYDFIEGEEILVDAVCHETTDSLLKLKNSTREILCLLEAMQTKPRTKCSLTKFNNSNQVPASKQEIQTSVAVVDDVESEEIKELEAEIRKRSEKNKKDCTVYNILTRQCPCLNKYQYNDFVIQFNDTKYITSHFGEIIKNLKILKKVIYMGGDYAKCALMFLNEGLSDSTPSEKVDIAQGFAHADICNVFENYSIIIVCILWPGKCNNIGDTTIQALTASLLFKLAQLEEGKRYLRFSSKITSDLQKVIREKNACLERDTLDSLNATLNIILPFVLLQKRNKDNNNIRRSRRKFSGAAKSEPNSEYQSPYRYERQVSLQAYSTILQNYTIKRPKIIPTYTV